MVSHILFPGECMRKSLCLAVLGLSIVVSAVSLGVTLTRYLGLLAYSPKEATQGTEIEDVSGISATPPEQWNNLFAPAQGMDTPSRLPAANPKAVSQAQRSNFVLVGTIVSSSPSTRRAILWTSGMKEPKAFREKEEVEPGAVLASIERDKVWIARGKEREKIEILPVGSRSRTTAAPQAPTASPSGKITPPLPALPTDASTIPWVAPPPRMAPEPRPALERTPAMRTPKETTEDEEEQPLTPRQQRRRARGLMR